MVMTKFEELPPIDTPFCPITRILMGDRVLVKQNDVTVAMGYNKFLSRSAKRGSGFGKYLKGNVIAKVSNTNYLDLQILTEDVLTDFLNHFYGLISGQPSRRQFFKGRTPKEIYEQAKTVHEILKGELKMCYDENSPEVKKGNIGEQIVLNQLNSEGYKVDVHPFAYASGASPVDFAVYKDFSLVFYAESKASKGAYPYGNEQAPCYSFAKVTIDGYSEFSKENSKPVYLYVLDTKEGTAYYESVEVLLQQKIFNARTFPRESFNTGLNARCYYFHQEQFSKKFPIPNGSLVKLRELFNLKQEPIELEEPKEIAKPKIPVEPMKLHGKVIINSKHCRTCINQTGDFWIVGVDYVQGLGLYANFQTATGQGRYAVEHSLVRVADFDTSQILVLNVEGAIKEILPKIISGEIKVGRLRMRETAKIVLEDLTLEYQRLTANKEPKEIQSSAPKEIQLFMPEQVQVTTPNDDKRTLFNQFVNVFNVDKEELFQLVDKAQEAALQRELLRLQTQNEHERAQLKELLK